MDDWLIGMVIVSGLVSSFITWLLTMAYYERKERSHDSPFRPR